MTRLFGKDMTRADLESRTGRLDQVAGIMPLELRAGRAEGIRGYRMQSGGGLEIVTLTDRNLDIAHASYEGIPICWRSPVGDVAPAYYEPEDDNWLRSFFGGLLTTCGLTNFGPGGTDSYGTVGLHGRISNLPATDIGCATEWAGDECSFKVWGTTREVRVFGENLSLQRTITMRLGGRSLLVEDAVTNHNNDLTPHMILYHCNGGFPILDEGAELHVSHESMRPRDAEAEKGLEVWNTVAPPQPGFKEQVFYHTPLRCDDGRAAIALVNRRARGGHGLGLAIRFDPLQLPSFQQWRMLGEKMYVMGMEPSNCPVEGRLNAEKQGVLPFLEAGETRRYAVEFQVLAAQTEIDAMIGMIEDANATARVPVVATR